ncbi:MAG: hypothetical protein LAT67_06405 [Balneolales bacterium]|nr:hypothetical protein [Balneolales bacterium]
MIQTPIKKNLKEITSDYAKIPASSRNGSGSGAAKGRSGGYKNTAGMGRRTFDSNPKNKSSFGSSRKSAPPKKRKMVSFAPGKMVLWSLLLGVCGYAYITHVFTTQQLLQEVSQVQREYSRVQMIYEDRSLTFDRMTGPADIFLRARELGYQDSGPADYVIIMEK